MRALLAVLGCLVIAAACAPAPSATAPSPTPSATATATVVPSASAPPNTAVPTPARPGEPQPTPPPVALPPATHVVSGTFAVGPLGQLIEVVGPYRNDVEAEIRRWVPSFLSALDRYRANPGEPGSRELFDQNIVPGPYGELVRTTLQPADTSVKRAFELGDFSILHMYAKPWGRVAYVDATLTYLDRVTTSDGKTATTTRAMQGRFVNQGGGAYKLVDGYDPILKRWVNGDQPRWSALALEAEAQPYVGNYLRRESYVPGEPYSHGASGATGPVFTTPFERAYNEILVSLDAAYKNGDFAARRYDGVSVRITRFDPATFLGDGVVTVAISGTLVTVSAGGAERTAPVTRTVKFYRITRDGLNAFWLAADELVGDKSLAGGDLALADIDRDRG